MVISAKQPSKQDANQTLKGSYNDVDLSITVNGFLVGKIGRKIAAAISTTNIANDTETYTFSEDSITLYVYKVIYTDGTRAGILTAERIA